MADNNAVKDIYKITNLINGKIYIGQSKDCKRRFREHCRTNSKAGSISIIDDAICKYGADNFSFEIIERGISNYNEREKYWIEFYRSNDREYGYNLTSGGEEPPVIKGDDSFFAKYPESLIDCVKYELMFTDKTFSELERMYGLSETYLSFLNRGIIRKDETLDYPLRKYSNAILPENKVLEVAAMLNDSFMSFEDVARKCNVSDDVVYDINLGNHCHCPENIEYPIRKSYARASEKSLQHLANLLRGNDYKISEIAEMLQISRVFISRFNNGKIYKQQNIEYPIRKSSQRVY